MPELPGPRRLRQEGKAAARAGVNSCILYIQMRLTTNFQVRAKAAELTAKLSTATIDAAY